MTFEAWYTLGVLALTVGLLVFSRMAPDLIMAASLTLV